jgi:hypothetical protein
MLLMIFTIIGVLIIIAGLYAKYVVLPIKYVLISGECTTNYANQIEDLSKCIEVEKGREGAKAVRPSSGGPSSDYKGAAVYHSDPSGMTNGIITLGSLIIIICALIYAYKKFVSKK